MVLISVMYYTCAEQGTPLFFTFKNSNRLSLQGESIASQVMFCCEYFQANIQKIPEDPNTEF